MTDRITKKRIGQLKEWLNNAEGDGYGYSEDGRAVADLEYILDQHQPAPTLMDLRGIAPDATGDLSSEEFVRRVREGWTPPWKKPAPTDEERGEMVALLSDLEEDPSYHWFEQWGNKMGKLAGKIRALLQSPPKASVTKEWLAKLGEHFIYIQIDEVKAMLAEKGIAVVVSDRPEEGKVKNQPPDLTAGEFNRSE